MLRNLPFVGDFPITLRFGDRPDLFNKVNHAGIPMRGHPGVDFALPVGTPVVAVQHGVVLEIRHDTAGYGRAVVIGHRWGQTFYAHLDEIRVQEGQQIGASQIIGLSGASGQTPDPQLHFGMRLIPYSVGDGWCGFTDPEPYLDRLTKSRGAIIGPHIIGGLYPQLDLLSRWQPRLITILDPNPDEVSALREVCPDSIIVARLFVDEHDLAEQIRTDPVAAANWAHDAVRSRRSPHIDYWQVTNEILQDIDTLPLLNKFELARMRLAERSGYRCAILAFSVGNPDLPEGDRLGAWRRVYPALERAEKRGHVVALHQYGMPDLWGPNNAYDWYILRLEHQVLRRLPFRQLKFAVTEFGIDGLIRGDEPAGWQTFTTPEGYVEQLLKAGRYLERFSGQVLGYSVFTLGHNSPWGTYDIAGKAASYLADLSEKGTWLEVDTQVFDISPRDTDTETDPGPEVNEVTLAEATEPQRPPVEPEEQDAPGFAGEEPGTTFIQATAAVDETVDTSETHETTIVEEPPAPLQSMPETELEQPAVDAEAWSTDSTDAVFIAGETSAYDTEVQAVPTEEETEPTFGETRWTEEPEPGMPPTSESDEAGLEIEQTLESEAGTAAEAPVAPWRPWEEQPAPEPLSDEPGTESQPAPEQMPDEEPAPEAPALREQSAADEPGEPEEPLVEEEIPPAEEEAPSGPLVEQRIAPPFQMYNMAVKPIMSRPDQPGGDIVYIVKDVFMTYYGSWESSGAVDSVPSWARDAYLSPDFLEAGADHHLFAAIIGLDGEFVRGHEVIFWSDGFERLGDPTYTAYSRERTKDSSGWANIFMAGGSSFVPESGESGPWCWAPVGAAEVVCGGGLPLGHPVSTFVVWQAVPRDKWEASQEEKPAGEEPAVPGGPTGPTGGGPVPALPTIDTRIGEWVPIYNLSIKPLSARPDHVSGDIIYLVRDVFTTRNGSWEPSPLPGSVPGWAREEYLKPLNAPDYFDDAGGDHHLFAAVIGLDGQLVRQQEIAFWSDGFEMLGDPDYSGYVRRYTKDRSGWANIITGPGSSFVPERGESGPWCWAPKGAAEVVCGGGLPANHHISFFVVWQAVVNPEGTQGDDDGEHDIYLPIVTGMAPGTPKTARSVPIELNSTGILALRQAVWSRLGIEFKAESTLAAYARHVGLGMPVTQEFEIGGMRAQGFQGGIVYVMGGDWNRVGHIGW